MDKNVLLRALKRDLTSAGVLKKELDGKITNWKDEYDGKPYGNEESGKSKIVSRDIKKQSEWQHANIIDPFVATPDIIKANPITFEDGPGARQAELLLNTQFCRQFDRYNFMSKAAKVLDREGTCVVQTGWDYKDEEIVNKQAVIEVDMYGNEYISGYEDVTELKVLVNKPTAVVCRNEDIFIDPTCQDNMDNCQFVIHRYETDLSTLRSDGRYKNLDKVNKHDGDTTDYDYDPQDDSVFRYEDDPRKKLVVHEYWGNYDVNDDGIAEPIVCAWINDTVIRLQSNPYPDNKVPFIVVPFNAIPFQMHGEANAELISDNQKIKTAVLRGIIDNMAQSNNGQKGIRKGALDVANKRKFMKGGNFEFNGTPADFWDGSYNQIPSSAFDVLGLMNNDIESMTGVKGFSGGITGNALGSSATGVRSAMDATATRRLNVVRNIAENLVKPLMRKWLAYDAEFLDETEVIRVTNDEYVEINRDDISGRIDIDLQVSTAEDNAAKAQELSFMLQTGAQTMDPAEVRMVRAEIARLQRMPILAKQIEDFQQEPDPVQQEMQQIALEEAKVRLANAQLEGEKIKAETSRLYSMASENAGDEAEKFAQAKNIEAKTNKLFKEAELIGSKIDNEDLKFIKDDNQTAHQEKMQEKEHDRVRALDELSFQVLHGDKNLGVSNV